MTAVRLTILLGAVLAGVEVRAATVSVPADEPTLQAAIDVAAPGDTVLVAPGIYAESDIALSGKDLTIASHFLTTGDPIAIDQTVFDGGGNTILELDGTTESTRLVGITWRNGDNGLRPRSKCTIENNRIETCSDGIDYEAGSGGVCRNNVFSANLDDAIDLDRDVDVVIENNTILDSGQDGIEVRLHFYSGAMLNYVIRWNTIIGSGEDGIQFIDYPGASDRTFVIERNLILDSGMAGIGCTSFGNTNENYEGASITDTIFLRNNVFDGQNHGISGGDNVTAENNIVINSTVLGWKNVDGGSTISNTCMWANGTNFQSSNVDLPSSVLADPALNPDYTLQAGSACIDAGAPGCLDPDGSVCDLGVFYRDQSVGVKLVSDPRRGILHPVRPNPFVNEARASLELSTPARVTVGIFDLRGRRLRTLVANEWRGSGFHELVWDGKAEGGVSASSGVYFWRLVADGVRESRRAILIRGPAR